MSWLEPSMPSQASGLSEHARDRLLAQARRELLERSFTGTFVYPGGALAVAWAVGLLAAAPRLVSGLLGVLSVIVVLRIFLFRSARRDTSRPRAVLRAHLVLGCISAALFSAMVGAAYVLRVGETATVTAGYFAMAVIAGGIVMVASTHRQLTLIWVAASIGPGLLALALHFDTTAQLLVVTYALYVPVLLRMLDRGHRTWWDAQLALARLDEQSHELARVSRRAGMAENAANVLHDVGNALNAVKTSSDMLADACRLHPSTDLGRLVALLEAHRSDLSGYLATNSDKMMRFLAALSGSAGEHATQTATEAARLQDGIRHIEAIVRRQQDVVGRTGQRETYAVTELVEAALGLSRAARAKVRIERDGGVRDGAQVSVDRDRVLQILVNLLENACDANAQQGTTEITVRVREDADTVIIEVVDRGSGIAPEVAERIFTRGFTTKAHGHGVGLHASFAMAQAMGAALSFESAGAGKGALFRLRLPLWQQLAA
ncbi:MAG TPA: ATP-binding protein [Nannocystaceae bacterium]|nr:ATP-binding protein [Nannocystaceae bacterium]